MCINKTIPLAVEKINWRRNQKFTDTIYIMWFFGNENVHGPTSEIIIENMWVYSLQNE